MHQTQSLIATLKRVIRSRGMTYRDLIEPLDLSESSIKRLFSEASFSLERLETVCHFLEISIADLVQLNEQASRRLPTTLTEEQEEALSLDHRAFMVFYLLLRKWSVEQIKGSFNLQDQDLAMVLRYLEELSLIERLPNTRVRLLTDHNIHWRKGGDIYRLFEREMKSSFLEQDFSQSDEVFDILSGSLTPASRDLLTKKVERLIREIEDLIATDAALPKDSTKSVGFFVAFGPLLLDIFKQNS